MPTNILAQDHTPMKAWQNNDAQEVVFPSRASGKLVGFHGRFRQCCLVERADMDLPETGSRPPDWCKLDTSGNAHLGEFLVLWA